MTESDPISELLDGENPDLSADNMDKREVAQHLVAAGLARHLLSEQAHGTAQTVREAMERIEQSDAAARRRTSWRWTAGLAAVASIVVSILVLEQETEPTLEPLIHRIERFASDDLDREYRVELTSEDMMVAMLAKSATTRLFVRGRDRFVARIDLQVFGNTSSTTWMGFDGEDSWLVPGAMPLLPGGSTMPVLVSKDGFLTEEDSGELGSFQAITEQIGLFMNLLADLGTDYDVQPTSKDAPPVELAAGEVDLTAYRRPQADYLMPDRIRVIVEEKTGVVRRLQMRFRPRSSRAQRSKPGELRLELVQETVVADDFYAHRAHHDPDRQVIVR